MIKYNRIVDDMIYTMTDAYVINTKNIRLILAKSTKTKLTIIYLYLSNCVKSHIVEYFSSIKPVLSS